MDRCIIVNADDFGLTNSINIGIIKSFMNGIVKSVSLMANGTAFDNAVTLISRFPELDVGLHLTLTNEKSISEPDAIKSLVANNGRFFTLSRFLSQYFMEKIRKDDIKVELKAQFEKAIKSGIKITHVDSHNHIHILPDILDIVIKLCIEFNVKYIRCPSEKATLQYALFHAFLKRLISMCAIKILTINARNKIRKSGLNSIPIFFGFFNSGDLKMGDIKRIVSSLKNGFSEFMVHPGEIDDELTVKYGHWNYNWEQEMGLLTQQNIKVLFEKNLIKLSNFRNLT